MTDHSRVRKPPAARQTLQRRIRELEDTLRTVHELQALVFSCKRREDGNIECLSAEGKLAEAFDLKTEKVAGKTLQEVFSPRIASYVSGMVERALSGETIQEEAPFFGRWFHITLTPVTEKNGTVTKLTGLVLDVTNTRSSRNQERVRSKNLKKILQSLPHLVFVCKRMHDGQVYVTFHEGALSEQFGFTPGNKAVKTLRELFPPKIVQRVLVQFERAFSGETVEFSVETGGKSYRVMATPSSGRSRKNPGPANEIVGFVTDVTDRKRTEEALHMISQGVTSATGEAFFRSLVLRMSHVLGVDCVFVSRIDQPGSASTLAVCERGSITGNLEYSLAGTPCEQVVERGFFLCPSGVQQAFPDDDMVTRLGADSYIGTRLADTAGNTLGILVVMHSRPFEQVDFIKSMLQIFAMRAAAELERMLAEEELVKSNAILKATQEISEDGILIVNDQRHVVGYNQRFADIWNLSRELLETRDERLLLDYLKPKLEEPEAFLSRVNELYAHPQMRSNDLVTLKDGRVIDIHSGGITLAGGKPYGRVWYIRDITDQQRYEEQIKQQSYYDQLTGLPNRVLFDDRLNQGLAQAQRNGQMLAVMSIDVDRFKVINETLGLEMGDRVLKEVARRLVKSLREGDTVSRLGDKFIVLLPGIQQVQEAVKLAQGILDGFAAPVYIDEYELYISLSIGISLYPTDGADGQTIVKHANAAMRRAKESGRNKYQLYTPVMSRKAYESLTLENDLHKAIDRGELLVYYQPRVSVATGRLVGMEALVRWNHPELGLISPGQFIPMAEEAGLIQAIDEYVLHTACLQNKRWQEAGFPPLQMAVNISARQFHQKDLAATVSQVLAGTRLDPQYLELEITESSAMHDAESAVATLHRLKDLGINLAIDDFGTGYSSFSYLKQFPIDTLKIDRSFVRDLTVDPGDAEIVSAIILLARSLKLKVVAEGVESEAQRRFLQRKKCEEMQGYLISPPLPPGDFERLMSEIGHAPVRP